MISITRQVFQDLQWSKSEVDVAEKREGMRSRSSGGILAKIYHLKDDEDTVTVTSLDALSNEWSCSSLAFRQGVAMTQRSLESSEVNQVNMRDSSDASSFPSIKHELSQFWEPELCGCYEDSVSEDDSVLADSFVSQETHQNKHGLTIHQEINLLRRVSSISADSKGESLDKGVSVIRRIKSAVSSYLQE